MAIWTFVRTDTGEGVEVHAEGQRMARGKTLVALGLRAEQAHLLSYSFRKTGRVRNGRKPWRNRRKKAEDYYSEAREGKVEEPKPNWWKWI